MHADLFHGSRAYGHVHEAVFIVLQACSLSFIVDAIHHYRSIFC
jgi:hypothetical protein